MITNYTLLTLMKELEGKFAAFKSDTEDKLRQMSEALEATTRWNHEQAVAAAKAAVYARTVRGRLGRAWRWLRKSRQPK